MVPDRLLPDAELVVVTRLRAELDLDELGLAADDVATTLGHTFPALTVEVAGGLPLIDGVLDDARLDLNGWARNRRQALELVHAGLAVLITSPTASSSGWAAAGVQVHRCRMTLRPAYSFDPVAQVPRYTASVALSARYVRSA